jgi:fatty-acyl-CoA synthase
MMIKTGGENVSEKEVEIFLESMPGIRNVQVVGVPHEKWGEAVTAIIETDQDHSFAQEDVATFCKDKISRYKIPKNVLFFNDNEWPLLGSGKIDKLALREKVVARLS